MACRFMLYRILNELNRGEWAPSDAGSPGLSVWGDDCPRPRGNSSPQLIEPRTSTEVDRSLSRQRSAIIKHTMVIFQFIQQLAKRINTTSIDVHGPCHSANVTLDEPSPSSHSRPDTTARVDSCAEKSKPQATKLGRHGLIGLIRATQT